MGRLQKSKTRFRKKKLLFLILFTPVFLYLINTNPPCTAPYDPGQIRAVSSGTNQSPAIPGNSSQEAKKLPHDQKEYSRSEESTYLTFPEWYIVYSSIEYANCLGTGRPSTFPYFSAIGQFWSNYVEVYKITKDRYKFNGGNHLMIVVIGTSLSAEYALKGFYENTIGRLTEWTGRTGERTKEDWFAIKVARDYADFIPTFPWYEFSFKKPLIGLWKETGLSGPNLARKWERKIFLTLEYGGKMIYSWLIEKGTRLVYTPESPDTYASIQAPETIFSTEPLLRKVKDNGEHLYIVAIPRYQVFTEMVPRLARKGVKFDVISQNSEIFLTVIAPADWKFNLQIGTPLFTNEILTQPAEVRYAIRVPVMGLHALLTDLDKNGLKIEHIYDY